MYNIKIVGAVLRAAPRRLAQAVVLVHAIGLWANAGWATALVTAVVNQRADAVVRSVQVAVRDGGPASPPPPTQEG